MDWKRKRSTYQWIEKGRDQQDWKKERKRSTYQWIGKGRDQHTNGLENEEINISMDWKRNRTTYQWIEKGRDQLINGLKITAGDYKIWIHLVLNQSEMERNGRIWMHLIEKRCGRDWRVWIEHLAQKYVEETGRFGLEKMWKRLGDLGQSVFI